MEKIFFEIDTTESALKKDDILIYICKCDNLNELSKFFDEHNIKLVNNKRYDPDDYNLISNSLLNDSKDELSKDNLKLWINKVGNKIFSFE